MLDTEKKTAIVKDFQRHEGDTGSTEVQVALITHRITQLSEHLQKNRQDHHSLRGLLKLVGHRRRLLAYLSREDIERYNTVVARLGIRK